MKITNIINKKTFLIITCMSFFSISNFANASSRIGVVGATNKAVIATNENGSERILNIGDEIFLNDTISSNSTGNAQLILIDKSAITIGNNSAIKIDNFVYNPSSSAGNLIMRGVKGTFRFIGGALSKNNSVKISTPVGIVGIRGGIGIIDIDPLTGATNSTFVYGKEMTFTNIAGDFESISKRGYGFIINTPTSVPYAVQTTPTNISNLVTSLSGLPGTSAGAVIIPTASIITDKLKTNSADTTIKPEALDKTSNINKNKKDPRGTYTESKDSEGNTKKTYIDKDGKKYVSKYSPANIDGSSSEEHSGPNGWTFNKKTSSDGTKTGVINTPIGKKYAFNDLKDIVNELIIISSEPESPVIEEEEIVEEEKPLQPTTSLDGTSFGCTSTPTSCNYTYWGNWANILNLYNDSDIINNYNLQAYTENTILDHKDIPISGQASYSGNVYGYITNPITGMQQLQSASINANINLVGSGSFIGANDLNITNFGGYNMSNPGIIYFNHASGIAKFENETLNAGILNNGVINGALFNSDAENFGGSFLFSNPSLNAEGIYAADKE